MRRRDAVGALMHACLVSSCGPGARTLRVHGCAASEDLDGLENCLKLRVASPPKAHVMKLRSALEYSYRDSNRPLWPVGLAFLSSEDDVAIVDTQSSALFRADMVAGKFYLVHLPANTLRWPIAIRDAADGFLVADDDGIISLSTQLEPRRKTRTFLQINDLGELADGRIVVNPGYRRARAVDPLLLVLDADGTRRGGFGARVSVNKLAGRDDEVLLAAFSGGIVAARIFLPEVLVFSLNGDLNSRFTVFEDELQDVLKLRDDKAFVSPQAGQTRLPRIIAGLSVIGGNIMVLIDLPTPILLRYSLKGVLLSAWVLPPPTQAFLRSRAFVANVFGSRLVAARLIDNTSGYSSLLIYEATNVA